METAADGATRRPTEATMMQVDVTVLPISPRITQLFIAAALGMFLGLEREWSQKSAGIRTFALTSLIGAISTTIDNNALLILGGVLVLLQTVLLGADGLLDDDSPRSLSLTTSASLFVAYSAGVMVAADFVLEAVVLVIISSLLLVLRRELHQFAWGLSKEEVKSAAEFAILAFVVYPLLPSDPVGPWNAIQPQLVWLLVVAVSGLGFVNYVIMQRYGSRGIAITGFFGGLVNSTAVIGEFADRAERNKNILSLSVGAVLLADAAMAVRNLFLVGVFIPEVVPEVGTPLGVIAIVGVGLSVYLTDWDTELQLDFDSPFSLSNALKFGGLFLVILVVSAGAQQFFGAAGLVTTSFLSGLISSGSTTTTAVTLYLAGKVSADVAAASILAGTSASIIVKIVLAASINRSLFRPVAKASGALIVAGLISGGLLAAI
ncbi:magnesium transporter accessory protein [Haloferax mediterranei ATCC 33500]|uniref:Magnesium transporter accessory protein n=2 Tax=Haloferax mediterranei (strain ATCC 33500 / DSM 1411 / JCM 8866 / NBRC 14739 / NCIMB 2177 / R-4) TaxID=523841 RepID=M0ISH9_HALMT|nr:magnesium transporter accessory protein [Haloferax mediterranei ATCC 33500]